jgi:hypothetical protein
LYQWINIDEPGHYDAIEDFLPDGEGDDFAKVYGLEDVSHLLESVMRPVVKRVLIEYPYLDKDYRSTYYNFYAKKGRRYRLDSIRIHFFGGTVTFHADTLDLSRPNADDKLHEDYYGFLTLRPTDVGTIGRTVISADAIKHAEGQVLWAEHKLHLLGHDLYVKGFPWMQQHQDIAVCAHVACWAILRHYSERYRRYREFLTHDITKLAHRSDPGGLVPSLGLHVEHAEAMFSAAGTYPLVIFHENDPGKPEERKKFLRQMFAYLDSGLPLFLAIGAEHAVVAAGYKWTMPPPGGRAFLYSWDMVSDLVTIDDNHMPYYPLSAAPWAEQRYSFDDINAYIVPLPEKIFFPAEAVDNLIPTMKSHLPEIQFPADDETVLRFFLMTAAGLRRAMRERASEYDPDLIVEIMQLPLAQFVWVAEFSTQHEWGGSVVSARAIIDATASVYEYDVLWAVYDRRKALFFDRTRSDGKRQLDLRPTAGLGYSRFSLNLRSVAV